ncbi:MAG: hypothetical protein NTY19_00645 [Planctomycetota bacterium]|nr:hypothetical protein [Planctomycetota bacterium]
MSLAEQPYRVFKAKKWGRHPACLSIHRVKRKLEAYATASVTLRLSLDDALAKVYVKVYAQMQDGAVKFYRDGYTDLRGRFDYTALSTNELDFVKNSSLLVLRKAVHTAGTKSTSVLSKQILAGSWGDLTTPKTWSKNNFRLATVHLGTEQNRNRPSDKADGFA